MAKQLRLKATRLFSNSIAYNLLWSTGRASIIAVLTISGSGENKLWAQTFEVPEGFTSTIEREETDAGDTISVVTIRPKEGNFTRLSAMTLRPIAKQISDPVEWLRRRMRLIISGNGLVEEIFDDPDSPFGGDGLKAMRDLFRRSLTELSKLAEWPLKYCDKVIQGKNLAGTYYELVCRYSVGTITQHLVLRLQNAGELWYQTTIRTMNKRRLRHFVAIANSFHL